MPKSLTECNNCFQRFESHYPYCPYCGDRAGSQLTLGTLFNNTISNYFSVDARFFKSFWPLIFKPGYLAKQFVEGRRLLYLHPAQMYLFISVIFFFLFSFISREQVVEVDNALKQDIERSNAYHDSINEQKIALKKELLVASLQEDEAQYDIEGLKNQELDSVKSVKSGSISLLGLVFNETEIDSMLKAGASDAEIYTYLGMKPSDGFLKKRTIQQIVKFFKNKSGGSILQAFYDNVPLAMFFLLPIFALILKLFYFRKGAFAHHLVFSFYFFAYIFMIFSLLVIVNLIWKSFPVWILALVMISTFLYLLLGVRRFYAQGYFISFIKSSVMTFAFLSFVLPSALFIMVTIAFLFY